MAEDDRTALRVGEPVAGSAPGDGSHDATQKVSSDLPPLSVGSMRAAPPPGTLIGKYIVERMLGAGGMGIVVAARHEQLGELVAIKLLHPKAAKDEVQRERFIREARATVRIKSEHVVRVLDAGQDQVTHAPYIVMEHLEGRDLGRVLEAHGAMPVTTAVDIMMQICEAVAGAHALGIIHRDLKPSNFFVVDRPGGRQLVKVLDFGISKASEQNGAPDPRLTETQAVFGSPTYMSPEQIRSSKNVDPRSDVWSLGVALFEMLTGKLPFVADNVAGLLASVVADPPFRVTVFSPDVPAELEAIVHACLEKDPSRRIGSAAELALRIAPFASADGMHLAQQIERIARATSPSHQSFPPHGLPASSSTHPSLPPLSGPHLPPLSHPPSAPSSPGAVAFGSTGDLSATGPALRASRRRGVMALVIALAAAFVVGGVLVGYATLLRSPRRDPSVARSAPLPPVGEPATPPPPVESVVAPPASVASAAVPAGDLAGGPTALAIGKRPARPVTGAGAAARPAGARAPGASASAPAAASAATAAPAPKPPPATVKPDDDRL